MNARQLASALRERRLLIASVVLIVTGIGLIVGLSMPTQYTSNLKLYVSSQVQSSGNSAYEGGLLSQQRVKSYTELISSPRIAQETLNRLNSRDNVEDFLDHISASSTLDSVVIDVNVTGEDPLTAAREADTIGAVFAQVVDQIERPSNPAGIAPVVVRIVQQGTIPERPSSIPFLAIVGASTLVGLILAVALAIAAALIDDRLKQEGEVAAIVGKSNLGVIPFSRSFSNFALLTDDYRNSPEAEAFRQLRTNLDFFNIDSPCQSIVVTSSDEAEGKTTTAVNLAAALSVAGRRVILLDCDLRRPKVSEHLGLESKVGVTSVLTGRVSLEQSIQRRAADNLRVIASGPIPPNPSELVSSERMRALLRQLKGNFDYVIVDTPPLLPVTDAAAIASFSDGVLLIAAYKRSTSRKLIRAREGLERVAANVLGSVFTMAPISRGSSYYYYNSSSYITSTASADSDASERISRPQQESNTEKLSLNSRISHKR